ncbi:2OG-Fe(II) oxygenase [Chroococcidiopsis thermalis PCC 7203]|uniref:2OG-Fe(II) oxygenase n=2 Tax=Chroococcidiopsis thermalis TaxID=54299 RepID=K9U2T1_CHRTP|nr:Fe2+-dependent dioxygenase [Chroococcidiopsis thermalis]AFY88736.1 2OG-Fe(II) oxygenase [Chroococcidiopsis thermalis PCC 7203]
MVDNYQGAGVESWEILNCSPDLPYPFPNSSLLTPSYSIAIAMILCIGNILNPTELETTIAKLEMAEFVDGKATAGWHARQVKHNTQLPQGSPALAIVRDIIDAALQRHALFQMAVRPYIVRPVTISRYDIGMSYGTHIDNALMYDPLMRSDVSMTIFLSDPTTYEGGELIIESTQGEVAFKLPAGSAIVYPSSTLHRVEAVTQGVRLAAVTWIQSLVRDPQQREILFDLDTARQTLFEASGKTPVFDLISKSHANLLRQWTEF